MLAVWSWIAVTWFNTHIGRAIFRQQLCGLVLGNVIHEDGIVVFESSQLLFGDFIRSFFDIQMGDEAFVVDIDVKRVSSVELSGISLFSKTTFKKLALDARVLLTFWNSSCGTNIIC